jgi:hypothetical protein
MRTAQRVARPNTARARATVVRGDLLGKPVELASGAD